MNATFNLNVQAANEVARTICSVDLDKDLLGCDNNKFYLVDSHGRLWRAIKSTFCKESQDCDYSMVAGKVREFLAIYEGPHKEQVAAQLKKLESFLRSDQQNVLGFPKNEDAMPVSPPTIAHEIEDEKEQDILELSTGANCEGANTCETVDESHNKNESELEKEFASLTASNPNFYWDLFSKYHCLTEERSDFLPYLPVDERLCRFNIPCPARTAVTFDTSLQEQFGYIHANHLSLGANVNFIATQYPLFRTSFWSMALEKGNVIVDLTNEADAKAHQTIPYYPQEVGKGYSYCKRITIRCLEITNLAPTLIKYTYKVKDLQTQTVRNIDRIHYTGWQDNCGTDDQELLELMRQLDSYLGKDQVPIVHCMAGQGRTGTCTITVALKKLIDQGQINHSQDLEMHLEKLILEGRKQRGPEFVYTHTQLATIWKVAQALLIEREMNEFQMLPLSS